MCACVHVRVCVCVGVCVCECVQEYLKSRPDTIFTM